MNKYKKLINNTAIIGLGTFGSKFLVFLLLRFYTACLSPSQLSDADIITQTANLLMPVLCAGMTDGVFRFALDKTENKRTVFTTGFVTILGGGAILLALMPIVLHITPLMNYFGNAGYLWLIYFYTVFACLHSLCAQFVRAIGKTTLFAVQGILATVITILLNILFLKGFSFKVGGYVSSIILADVLSTLFLVVVANLWKVVRVRTLRRDKFRAMLRYSVPLIPTTVFWWVTNASDRYMVKGFLGGNANGLYSAAYRIPTLLILASGIFIEAWQFSAVTEADTDRREHSHFFGVVFGSFQALIFLAGAVLIALAKVISAVLFAKSFSGAWNYIPILVFATVFSSLVTFLGSVYLVDKKSVMSLVTSCIGAVLNILLNLLLIRPMGPNGAGLATFLSYFVVFVIRAMNTRRYLPFDLHTKKLLANTLIMCIQTCFMVFEVRLWIPMQFVCIMLLLAINITEVLGGVKQVLKKW